jgi:predicted enzyme related to lactoylglutathione lyase
MLELLINIDVDDLAEATAFYTRALGLTIGRRFGDAGVELMGASSPIYLLAKPAGSAPFGQATVQRTYTRHWTPVHMDIVVQDIEFAVHQAEAAGAKREGAISEHAWGRMAMMADPFGHGFCLLQFQGQGYDEIATRE